MDGKRFGWCAEELLRWPPPPPLGQTLSLRATSYQQLHINVFH
jgi:hypothetical protein